MESVNIACKFNLSPEAQQRRLYSTASLHAIKGNLPEMVADEDDAGASDEDRCDEVSQSVYDFPGFSEWLSR